MTKTENKVHWAAWPQVLGDEAAALSEVINSHQWGTLGPQVGRLSAKLEERLGVRHAVLVNSGTRALELALSALGIGYGDEVIVSGYTFVATATAVMATGAVPVIADVDPETAQIDPDDVRAKLTERTKAVIAVHLGGRPAPLAEIRAVLPEGVALVEDCAQAFEAVYRGRPVGTIGTVGCFSFQNSKNLTSGEGGMIATNDDDVYAAAWHYHHSGRTLELESAEALGGRMLMGTNARLTDFQAAVLNVQLEGIEERSRQRAIAAARLTDELRKIPELILPPPCPEGDVHAYHLYVFRLDGEWLRRTGLTKKEIVKRVNAEGVPLSCGYTRMQDMGIFSGTSEYIARQTGSTCDYRELPLPGCDLLVETAVWFHHAVLLSPPETLDRVAAVIKEVIAAVG